MVPILRAGLVPIELISTVLPAYETYHVGIVRDDDTLQVTAFATVSAPAMHTCLITTVTCCQVVCSHGGPKPAHDGAAWAAAKGVSQ